MAEQFTIFGAAADFLLSAANSATGEDNNTPAAAIIYGRPFFLRSARPASAAVI
jgi:hypothetical protein